MGATYAVGTVSDSPEYFAFQVMQCEYNRWKTSCAFSSSSASTATADAQPHERNPEVIVAIDEVVGANASSEINREHFMQIYHQAVVERDIDLLLCRSPSVIIYKYLLLSEDDKVQYLHSVIEAATSREKKGASNQKKKIDQDYSKSFGGTAEDTKVKSPCCDCNLR